MIVFEGKEVQGEGGGQKSQSWPPLAIPFSNEATRRGKKKWGETRQRLPVVAQTNMSSDAARYKRGRSRGKRGTTKESSRNRAEPEAGARPRKKPPPSGRYFVIASRRDEKDALGKGKTSEPAPYSDRASSGCARKRRKGKSPTKFRPTPSSWKRGVLKGRSRNENYVKPSSIQGRREG